MHQDLLPSVAFLHSVQIQPQNELCCRGLVRWQILHLSTFTFPAPPGSLEFAFDLSIGAVTSTAGLMLRSPGKAYLAFQRSRCNISINVDMREGFRADFSGGGNIRSTRRG
jgi:hypothetical protein